MNYKETINYLFNQLPMYQRMGKAAYKTDLSNTIQMCAYLDNPEMKFKTVHIAGTNGKGSTSHLIASVLQEAGYKVGLYTSPHLLDFRERIKINGAIVDKDFIVDFVAKHKEYFEKIQLSFFEMTVAIAFQYFFYNKVDIAIIETGLGGRLDSTNVILPEMTVITNIAKDHTLFLGDTLKKIAIEKAGIIKPHIPIVIGETQSETKDVFSDFASNNNSNIVFADKQKFIDIPTDLKGNYQLKNKNTAYYSILELQQKGWKIEERNIINGFSNVVKNTGLLGRWQTLQQNPLTVCDTGHNEAGIKEIVNQINQQNKKKLHIVFGAVNDKSITTILALLPQNATYYFCQASIPRALNVAELHLQAIKSNLRGNRYNSVKEAVKEAINIAELDDFVFIGGSTFVVAEALELF